MTCPKLAWPGWGCGLLFALSASACSTAKTTSSPGGSAGAAMGGTTSAGSGGTNGSAGAGGASGGSAGTSDAGGDGNNGGSAGSATLEAGFWGAGTMTDDPLLFVQEDGQASATARLLFAPASISAIHSANGTEAFEEGVDFSIAPGSRELTLTADSNIPFKTTAEMHPAIGSPQSISGAVGGETDLFFGEGHLFHDLQVVVTYEHADAWDGYEPPSTTDQLPKTLGKLQAAQPVKIVVLGDSISEGASATGFVGVSPNIPPYAQLVTTTLADAYQAAVTVENLAVGGTGSDWGVDQASAVAAQLPDLAIIAFGMNDTWVPIETYTANVNSIVSGVRAAAPDTEFILVASMAGNAEWTGLNSPFFTAARDSLATLTGPGVVLADVTSLWLDVVSRKKFVDMTGNGVNHPNDFGHRLYTEVITRLLLP